LIKALGGGFDAASPALAGTASNAAASAALR
jgi:hypothetical protein